MDDEGIFRIVKLAVKEAVRDVLQKQHVSFIYVSEQDRAAQLLRAPDQQATSKATVEDIIEIVEPYIVRKKDFEEVSRLLRERLVGG